MLVILPIPSPSKIPGTQQDSKLIQNYWIGELGWPIKKVEMRHGERMSQARFFGLAILHRYIIEAIWNKLYGVSFYSFGHVIPYRNWSTDSVAWFGEDHQFTFPMNQLPSSKEYFLFHSQSYSNGSEQSSCKFIPLFMRGKSHEENEDVSLRPKHHLS